MSALYVSCDKRHYTEAGHEQPERNADGKAGGCHACDARGPFRKAAPKKRSRGSQHTGPEPDRAASRRPFRQIAGNGRRAVPAGDQRKNPFRYVIAMHR
jgi:hypothetical protein